MQMSLRFKTITGVALIEAVLLTLLITLGLDYLRTTSHDEMKKRAETTAKLFAATTKDAVLSWDLASLDAFSHELLTNPDILYVRITDPKGMVLAQQGDKAALAQPFEQDHSVTDVTDNSFDQLALIEEAGTLFGHVELGLDIRPLSIQINKATRWSYAIAAGEMALVALFSFILGSYLTRRLSILANAAHLISAGKKSIQLEVNSKDEVGLVAEAFNEMSAELQKADAQRDKHEQTLKQLNSELEQRVARRTQTLTEKNHELEETNQQLKAAQQQLVQSQKMASLGTFAAGMAHEINNPIGVIKSNLQVLEEYIADYDALNQKAKADGSPPLQSWLAQQDFDFINQDFTDLANGNQQATQRIITIINGLQEFAQQDAPLESETRPLNALIKTICQQETEHHPNKPTLQFNLEPTKEIEYKETKVTQVLSSIISNAAKAIPEKGQIWISSHLHAKTFSITVLDKGKGIPQKELPAIFDPFFTRWDVGEGAGLGLSIAYNTMQLLGGNIEVQSAEGKGTAVRLTFPR